MKRTCNNVFGPSSASNNMHHQEGTIRATLNYTDKSGRKKQEKIPLESSTVIENVHSYIKYNFFKNDERGNDLFLCCDDGKLISLSDNKSSTVADLGLDMTNPQLNYTIQIISPPATNLSINTDSNCISDISTTTTTVAASAEDFALNSKKLGNNTSTVTTATSTTSNNMTLYVNDALEDDLLLGASASPTTGETPAESLNDSTNDIVLGAGSHHHHQHHVPGNAVAVLEEDAATTTTDHSTHCVRCRVGPGGDSSVMESSSSPIGCSSMGTAASALLTSTTAGPSTAQTEPATTAMNNYVGLVNQAMTCYLNSLVQALFMTPEFRNAIYNWVFDGQNETRSIPYQLQKLFLNLQTSNRSAVETTDLTTSFGWQGSEAWNQHDIQELCRVMFDALERKFKNTKQANLINDLYEGKMLDYVKCLECGTEKSREDTFLDIPLPVRPFGSAVAYNSVEEALRAFVQPETLEGNNQYFCEKCGKKCDAHKGLKFIKFPYLLTLHLKRFDFDYNTMHRIKLNDKVVFPEKLNLNSFVPNARSSAAENEPVLEDRDVVGGGGTKCDDCSTTDSGSALDDESCCHGSTDLSSSAVNDADDNCEDSDEGIDVSSGNAHHEPEAKGPYVYELFSIMIHSGSASGGHYYAYIKDFDKNCWFCFNDQSVTRITEEDIKKTYGGGPQKGYYSSVYTSSTNAYMLMYRQIDKERNCEAMKNADFPPHIHSLLEHMRKREKTDRANKEKQNNSFKLNVYCYHPTTEELLDVRITLFGDSSLEDAAALAHRRFKLEGLVNVEDCRMVIFNRKQACIDMSFDSDTLQQKFCDVADTCKTFCDWLLEIKAPGEVFKRYKKGGINMRVYRVNLDTEDVSEPVMVRVDHKDTVRHLKGKLSELMGTDMSQAQVVLEKFCCEPKHFDDDDECIQYDYICPEYKLYVCDALDEDPERTFEESKLKRIIERFEFIVHLDVILPDTDPSTLDALGIPTLEMAQLCEKLDPANNDECGGSGSNNNLIGNTAGAGNSPNIRISPQPGNVGSHGNNNNNASSLAAAEAFDQSNSEDSSLSDSDRTLVGDAPSDARLSSFSNSPPPPPLPGNGSNNNGGIGGGGDPAEDSYDHDVLGNPADVEEMNWDSVAVSSKFVSYFRVTSVRECRKEQDVTCRLCKIFVDHRMTLDVFKKHLESVVRVPKEYFKVFRHYPTADEEWSTLSDTLRMCRNGHTVSIKLGRALSMDEFSCKIFLLRPESNDPTNFLFEHILSSNETVAQAKREILLKAKKQHMIDIPYSRARLREKCFKKPRKVYLDDQRFVTDILLISNFEMYLQELSEPERVTSSRQLSLFTKHWSPSTLTLHHFQEIILETPTMEELKRKVSELTGGEIPEENVEVAFVRNIFPFDMHLLDIHTELDWNPNVEQLDQWPLQAEDGTAFFYRDSREQLKVLSPEERKEINIKENTRLGRLPTKTGSTWEKSLRIYSDNWPSETEDNCID